MTAVGTSGQIPPNAGVPGLPYNLDGSLALSGSKISYSAVSTAFTPGATPQDIFTITGSATKTIKVSCISISTDQTTAGTNKIFLVRRSSALTGGTSASVTAVASDVNNPAASATILQYTANSTGGGTLIGNIWGGFTNSPAAATAGIGGFIGTVVEFTENFGQSIVLRGIGDVLAVNLGGVALPAGLSVIITIDWSEE